MLIESKTVFSGKYVYKLSYRLSVYGEEFFISIKSEKYDRREVVSQGKTPHAEDVEINESKLPIMQMNEAVEFFRKVSENLVFPYSLDYIIEDMEEIPKAEGKSKITA